MVDATIKAYATRQLGSVLLAIALSAGLALFAAVSDARTTSRDPAGVPAAAARSIAGIAVVTDGDTITVAGVRVRLEGIDAPEAGQQCLTRFGHAWPCGTRATNHLARLVDTLAARRLPAERLLVETDAPYLTPVPFRGKPNRPAHVVHTLRFLAALREEEPETLDDVTSANAARVFGW